MIRAVVRDGMIQPLDPLPRDWDNGHQVVVGDAQELSSNGAGRSDTWAADMDALTADLNDPQEWQQVDAALTEADRQSKDLVRRQMGLP